MNQAILQKREMKNLSLNKNLWKLTILITWKNKNWNEKRQKKTWNSWKKTKKNKSLKQKKKLDEERIEEKELWGKLNELNKEFETINNIKKKQKNV